MENQNLRQRILEFQSRSDALEPTPEKRRSMLNTLSNFSDSFIASIDQVPAFDASDGRPDRLGDMEQQESLDTLLSI